MAAFIENILIGKRYIGIEFFSVNNKDNIAFVQVEKNKSGLIISKNELFETIESLSKEKTNCAAVLVINNIHVLQKEIQGTDPNDKKLLHKAFPNLIADDFYYEIWRKDTISIISICRKSYVDDLIHSIQSSFKITAVSLGVCAIANLTDFALPDVIATNTQTLFLSREENIIHPEKKQNKNYSINELNISNANILGFAALLKLIFPGKNSGTITDLNTLLTEEFKQKTFFEKGIKIGVGFIFIILIINFFLFSYYFDKATVMNEKVSLNKTDIENVKYIKQRIKDKEEILKNFTNISSSRSALLINKITSVLPSSILLSEIFYHPLEKKVKDEEQIISLDNTINISGTTLSNQAFTSWIENIEKIKSIKEVTIISFGKNSENETVFSIKIVIQ